MDELTLLDWKRRIFELYAEMRVEHDLIDAWRHWRESATGSSAHPQSPYPPRNEPGSRLPYFDYDPALRAIATVDEAERVPVRSPQRARPYSFMRFARAHFRSPKPSTASTCTGSRATQAALYLWFADATAAPRRTAQAAICSTRSRARISASGTGSSCSTSTSPTTRRARTTRAGSARSRRRGTGSAARSGPASATRSRRADAACSRRRMRGTGTRRAPARAWPSTTIGRLRVADVVNGDALNRLRGVDDGDLVGRPDLPERPRGPDRPVPVLPHVPLPHVRAQNRSPLPHWLTLHRNDHRTFDLREARLDDPEDLRLDRTQVPAERIEEGHDHRDGSGTRSSNGLPVRSRRRAPEHGGRRPSSSRPARRRLRRGRPVRPAQSGRSEHRSPPRPPRWPTGTATRRCLCARIQPARNSLCSARSAFRSRSGRRCSRAHPRATDRAEPRSPPRASAPP